MFNFFFFLIWLSYVIYVFTERGNTNCPHVFCLSVFCFSIVYLLIRQPYAETNKHCILWFEITAALMNRSNVYLGDTKPLLIILAHNSVMSISNVLQVFGPKDKSRQGRNFYTSTCTLLIDNS